MFISSRQSNVPRSFHMRFCLCSFTSQFSSVGRLPFIWPLLNVVLKFASFSPRPKPTSMQKTTSTISIHHYNFVECVVTIHPTMHAIYWSLLLQRGDPSYSGFSWGPRQKFANRSLPAPRCVQSWRECKKPLVRQPTHTSSWKTHITAFYIQRFFSRWSSVVGLLFMKLLLLATSRFASFSFCPKLT